MREDSTANVQYSIRWPAVFAGAFVAFLVHATLMALGMAIGGSSLGNVIQGDATMQGFGIGAGVWIIGSILASLFVGAYVAGRVGGFVVTRIGRIQGLVVAGLFFALMFSQVGSILGGIGNTAGFVGSAASDVAQSSEAQSLMNEALDGLNLRSPPETVASGLVSRLVRGDQEAAFTYLSRQAGVTRAEAQQRIETVRAELDQALTQAGNTAADAMKAIGWTLFGSLVLGSIFAMLGGGVGAQVNLRLPLSETDRRALRESRAA